MGDIIDCLNGFHHTSAKSMTVFFFFFAGFLSSPYLSYAQFTVYLFTHSTDLPAASQTSMMIDYELHPFFKHPAKLSQRAFLSYADLSMSRSCN